MTVASNTLGHFARFAVTHDLSHGSIEAEDHASWSSTPRPLLRIYSVQYNVYTYIIVNMCPI